MISIVEQTYGEMAAQFAPLLQNQTFFNGHWEFFAENGTAKLIASLILVRNPQTSTEQNIIPVWWEFHFYGTDGQEIETDFEWSELCHHLIQHLQ